MTRTTVETTNNCVSFVSGVAVGYILVSVWLSLFVTVRGMKKRDRQNFPG